MASQALPPYWHRPPSTGVSCLLTACLGLGQPTSLEPVFWYRGQIGLDVQDGRSVEHVQAANPQRPPLTREQLNHCKADRIGSAGGSRCKDGMRPIVGRWRG